MSMQQAVPFKTQTSIRGVVAVCAAVVVALGSPAIAEAQGTSDAIVPATDQGYRSTSEEFARLYGPGVFTHTALGNTIAGAVDGHARVASNRFRATQGGVLDAVRLYWPTGSGYSKGTGGNIKVSVLPDDGSPGHFPDLRAEPLAVTYYQPNLVDGQPREAGPLLAALNFESKEQRIVAGELYHVMVENVDPRPAENFISINHSLTDRRNGRPARWLDPVDWGSVIGHRPVDATGTDYVWKDISFEGSGDNLFSPIMELTYAGGEVQGVFDMESGSVVPDRMYTVTADNPIRERFTPTVDRVVSGFSVATAAYTPGSLGWRIKRGDEVLAEGTIEQPEADFQVHNNTRNDIGSYTWYDVALPERVELPAGDQYDLEFRALGESQWKIGDHSNGSAYDVAWPAAFTESQAQHLHDGAWINTNHWDHAKPGRGTNWPVVLHLAP
ncbi:hypothetical protein [Corynebacterium sp.]|uniref:hypothetical protein n=1 Tax=Corynebacterium sp. TaxID=1720 RepID=UPI0026DC883D|nr:hypothetical protein [Corynebacterium sp.]MDO5076357.1 hypothetical protein [Corynebacterium sp.]